MSRNLDKNAFNFTQPKKGMVNAMNKTVAILMLLTLVALSILLLVLSMLPLVLSSPFLVAATIVALVALFGSVFSLFLENRSRNRKQDPIFG